VFNGPVDWEPLTPLTPDQAPDAVQAVASWADQVSVEDPPALTVLGFVCKAICGALDVTVTVADCDAEPPCPVQVSSNSVLLVSCPLVQVPLVGSEPCQPPPAQHCVALEVLHARVVVPGLLTVVGDAVNVMAGACALVTMT
jgi:hypothetical protein